MPALGLEALLHLVPLGTTPEQLKALNLAKKSITKLPQHIRMFSSLRRVDLSHNELTSIAPVATLLQVTNLNVSHNQITSLLPLAGLKLLTVLNIAANHIASLEGVPVDAPLKALIANENKIVLGTSSSMGLSASVKDGTVSMRNTEILERLVQCEVVVLSRNAPLLILSDSSDATKQDHDSHPLGVFAAMPELKKLALSECAISSLPTRWFLPKVTELRLAKNALTNFPETVILRSVQLLDIAHNQLPRLEALRRCTYLQQLSARGNAFTASAETADSVQWFEETKTRMILSRMFANLRMVDSSPFQRLDSKEEYFAAKKQLEQSFVVRGDTKENIEDRETPSEETAKKGTKRSAAKRPRSQEGDEAAASGAESNKNDSTVTRPVEEVEDRVLEIGSEAAQQQRSSKPIVRRMTSAVAAESTAMVGNNVALLLKKRKDQVSGW